MPWIAAGIVVMTARGLLIDAGAGVQVFIDPATPCQRIACQILRRPHDPLQFGESLEIPCCGTWAGYQCLSPAENVPWDGQPCNNPGERPGCCQCSCPEYRQWFWVVGWGGSPGQGDALLIGSGAASITVIVQPPCAIPPPCVHPCSMLDPDTGVLTQNPGYCDFALTVSATSPADYNGDGDAGTDGDIEDFFRCLAGACCPHCAADFDMDGEPRTDADIQCFFQALGGGSC